MEAVNTETKHTKEDLLARLDRVGVHQSVAARYCKEAAAEIRRLREDLGAALIAGMQGDSHAVERIAVGYRIEFPDGAPVANTPEADDE